MSDPHPCCCVSGAHSCTGPQGTLSAGTTCATIRLESASTRQTQKATAPKTACTALLLMGPMTSAPLSTTSGGLMAEDRGGGLAADAVSIPPTECRAGTLVPSSSCPLPALSVLSSLPRELQAMEALQNGQTTVEGSIEGQSAGAASHAMIEKILSEEPRWQGKGGHTNGHAPSHQLSVLPPLLPMAALRTWLTTTCCLLQPKPPPLLGGTCPLIPPHIPPTAALASGGTSGGVSPDTPCPAPVTPGAP